jgi:hypothetical protein
LTVTTNDRSNLLVRLVDGRAIVCTGVQVEGWGRNGRIYLHTDMKGSGWWLELPRVAWIVSAGPAPCTPGDVLPLGRVPSHGENRVSDEVLSGWRRRRPIP